MSRSRCYLGAVLSLLICFTFSACFKKSSKPSETAKNLVKMIPNDAFGYFVWDGTGSPFKKYQQSAWAQGSSLFANDLVSITSTSSKRSPGDVLKALEDSGLIGKDGKPGKVVAAVGYATIQAEATRPEEKFAITAYGELTDTQAGNNIIATIKKEFAALDDTTVTDGCGDLPGFTAAPSNPKTGPVKLHFCNQDKKIVLTTKLSEAKALFDGRAQEPGESHISKAPELTKIAGSISGRDKEYLFAFADVYRLVKAIPDSEKKEFSEADLPFKAVALSRQMHEAPKDIGLMLMGESEEAKEIDTILSSDGSLQALQHLASGSAFSIGLDMRLFKLIDHMSQKFGQDNAPEQLALLKKMFSFGLGVEQASAGSPFPTISLVAKSSAAKELEGELEANVAKQVGNSGIQAGGWQSKDVDGTKMRYLATPFGIGLYAGAQEDTFILSTNENGFKSGIKSVDSNLMAEIKKQLSDQEPETALALTYIDFTKVADIVTSVQSTLAMFLGGKSNLVTNEQVEELKSFGTALGTLHYDDNLLTLSSVYVKPKKS